MPKSKQNLAREILTVALLLAAVAASEYWFFQLWRLDWSVPMLYGGDGIYWVGQVQRSYGELSGSLGWPFYEVAGKYDPNYDLIYDIFVWFVGLFTKDTGTFPLPMRWRPMPCSAWWACAAGSALPLASPSV